ncbi:hypothetical protein [Canibacter zhuwentaonis]|nr:hypothetical protein [Canibacter zhuwentaonis]
MDQLSPVQKGSVMGKNVFFTDGVGDETIAGFGRRLEQNYLG